MPRRKDKVRGLVDDPEHKIIVADREYVALERDGAYIDILTVREACAKGVDDLPTDRLQELAQAWRGDFLEGLELPDCRGFQAWCVAERDESRALHAKILRALVGRFAGNPDESLFYKGRPKAPLGLFELFSIEISCRKRWSGRQTIRQGPRVLRRPDQRPARRLRLRHKRLVRWHCLPAAARVGSIGR